MFAAQKSFSSEHKKKHVGQIVGSWISDVNVKHCLALCGTTDLYELVIIIFQAVSRNRMYWNSQENGSIVGSWITDVNVNNV